MNRSQKVMVSIICGIWAILLISIVATRFQTTNADETTPVPCVLGKPYVVTLNGRTSLELANEINFFVQNDSMGPRVSDIDVVYRSNDYGYTALITTTC